jgi:hypothetical protein
MLLVLLRAVYGMESVGFGWIALRYPLSLAAVSFAMALDGVTFTARSGAVVAPLIALSPPRRERASDMLADEPTGNLDSHNNTMVLDLLRTHARSQGALVLIATHNPEIARSALAQQVDTHRSHEVCALCRHVRLKAVTHCLQSGFVKLMIHECHA